MMRCLFFCLACLPATSMAQTTPDSFNQEQFEKRFRAADKDGDGSLSREEAYAAFPKAPEFFDEIDADNDNQITLTEVSQARARRIEAILSAGSIGVDAVIGEKYIKQDYVGGDRGLTSSVSDPTDLSSAIAHRRSSEFHEFLGDDQAKAGNSGDKPAPPSSSSNLLNKSFKPLSY